jgi:hypothetical protein
MYLQVHHHPDKTNWLEVKNEDSILLLKFDTHLNKTLLIILQLECHSSAVSNGKVIQVLPSNLDAPHCECVKSARLLKSVA